MSYSLLFHCGKGVSKAICQLVPMSGAALPFAFLVKKYTRKNPNSPTMPASLRFLATKSRHVSFIPSDLIESPTALQLLINAQQKVWLF